MQKALEAGDYAEVLALGRHALRGGDDRPAVHYYYGLGLVGSGRDHEGFLQIDQAVEGDDRFAGRAAGFLWEQAQAKPRARESARRMRKALQLDPTIDPGPYRFAVADVCFSERDYADAARFYEEAVRDYPDSSACEVAYARLAECWSELKQPEKAKAVMETLMKKYPRGTLASRAGARLDNASFDDAQAAYDAGDYARAVEVARAIVESTGNRSLQQKARYLLGESYEATGDVASAYATYREIIRTDRGDSGRIVERARARIEALQEAGLR